MNAPIANLPEEPEEKETRRLEAFSDGVFAVAITLLVFEFKVPDLSPALANSGSLGRLLVQQWPSYFALVTSFFTILVMWVHHHALFKKRLQMRRLGTFCQRLLAADDNVVPYPTSVLARFLETPAAKAAVAFYCGTFILIAIGFKLVLRAAFRKKLLVPSTPMDFVIRTCRRYLAGPPLYFLAFLAAFWDVRLSPLICTLLWIFWAATITIDTRA